jgi:hypothetical protein
VDTNAAAALSLSTSGRLRRVDDSHVLCTSTLGVLHNTASRAARMGLLACRSARHAVVELKITVKLNTDLKFIDRECGNIGRGTASKAGAARDIRLSFAGDACVLGYVRKGGQTKLIERAWNVRLLKLSRLEPLPKELAQEKPPKLRPPYWEKDPNLRPLQLKPEDC